MESYTMFLDWKNQHCENDKNIFSVFDIQLEMLINDILRF